MPKTIVEVLTLKKRIPPLIFEPHWVLVEGTTENLSDLTKSSFVGDILLNDVKK